MTNPLVQAIDERIKELDSKSFRVPSEHIFLMKAEGKLEAYRELKQLAIAEQERIVKEIEGLINPYGYCDFEFQAKDEVIKIVKGE